MSESLPGLLTIHEEKVLEPSAAGRSISWIAEYWQIGEDVVTQQLRTAASKFP
ncbi:MAG TPA: hypothetical protein VI159_09000 [Gemmatimonadales bacterium]